MIDLQKINAGKLAKTNKTETEPRQEPASRKGEESIGEEEIGNIKASSEAKRLKAEMETTAPPDNDEDATQVKIQTASSKF